MSFRECRARGSRTPSGTWASLSQRARLVHSRWTHRPSRAAPLLVGEVTARIDHGSVPLGIPNACPSAGPDRRSCCHRARRSRLPKHARGEHGDRRDPLFFSSCERKARTSHGISDTSHSEKKVKRKNLPRGRVSTLSSRLERALVRHDVARVFVSPMASVRDSLSTALLFLEQHAPFSIFRRRCGCPRCRSADPLARRDMKFPLVKRAFDLSPR